MVALLSGAVLAITGVISFGSRSGTTDNAATTTGTSTNTVPGDQQPIEMPATLAGFIDQGKAIQDVNAGAGQDRIAHLDQINQLTTTAMKESFGDVGVGVRSDATPGLESFGTGIALRAPAPLLEVLHRVPHCPHPQKRNETTRPAADCPSPRNSIPPELPARRREIIGFRHADGSPTGPAVLGVSCQESR